jgi:hypothetical protein
MTGNSTPTEYRFDWIKGLAGQRLVSQVKHRHLLGTRTVGLLLPDGRALEGMLAAGVLAGQALADAQAAGRTKPFPAGMGFLEPAARPIERPAGYETRHHASSAGESQAVRLDLGSMAYLWGSGG